jgi:hypothetical protein
MVEVTGSSPVRPTSFASLTAWADGAVSSPPAGVARNSPASGGRCTQLARSDASLAPGRVWVMMGYGYFDRISHLSAL